MESNAPPADQAEELGARYQELIGATEELDPVRCAVAHPCDTTSLIGALEAKAKGLIEPILVGPETKIAAAADEAGRSADRAEPCSLLQERAGRLLRVS